MKFLEKADIGATVADMFSPENADRARVILVAYVGKNPMSLVSDVRKARVFCWPDPRSTRWEGVAALLKAKAEVHFVDNLHMKVYWADGLGAVVGSPNLSDNGLAEGLHEYAVRVPMTREQIDAIVNGLDARPVLKAELDWLRVKNEQYARAADAFHWKAKGSKGPSPAPPSTYLDWWSARQSTGPEYPWKLGFWNIPVDANEYPTVNKRAREATGQSEVHDHISASTKRAYSKDDWILTCRLRKDGRPGASVHWLRVDDVIKVPKHENKADPDCPWKAVQWRPWPASHPRPPFALTKEFVGFLRSAVKDLDLGDLDDVVKPSEALLVRLAEHAGLAGAP